MRGTQQAAGWRVSFGRQATLRGCDGACALSVGATDSVRGATDSGQSALPMLGVRQCALSPFPACQLYPRLSEVILLTDTVSQHGASRCAEMRYASRYRSSLWRIFPPLGEIERRRAGLGCSWGARSARADLEQNCAFDGVHAALEEQRPEWSAVRTFLRTLAAYGGRRCRIWSGEAAERSMVAEGG